MSIKLLKEDDVIIEQNTGNEYQVWWISKTRATAKCINDSKSFFVHDVVFVRDISNGIKTYPKSERKFKLKNV